MLKRLKNWLIFVSVRGLLRLLRALPLGLLLALGRPLGRVAHALAWRERRRALANLEHVGWPGDSTERRALVRRMFAHLGRGACEVLALRRILARPGAVEFEPGSLKALERALASGKGAVFVTAHLGNWELMGAAVARHAPVSVLFKPSYDPRFTELMVRARRELGVAGIDVSRPGHLRRALLALGRGEVLGVLLDQPVSGAPELPFFGRPAPTTLLPARLAQSTGAAVLVGFARRRADGTHCVSIRATAALARHEDPARATLEYVHAVEQAVGQAPAQWVWSLDRWHVERPELDLDNVLKSNDK